jgi:hypothetical protein
MYNGYDKDNLRAADNWLPNSLNQGPPGRPAVPDTPGSQPKVIYDWNFGGPHPGGWIALFCDGAVRFLSYDMDPLLHQNFATRNDMRVTSFGEL